MARALTAKQNHFVRMVATGSSYSDAYKAAYSAENMTGPTIYVKASLLAGQDKIRANIDNMRDAAAEAEGLTVETSMKELNALKKAAVDGGNYGAAVRTEELRGKLAGLYVERHEGIAQTMSDEDLAKSIAGADHGPAYDVSLALARGEPMNAERIAGIAARHMNGPTEVEQE